jgi:hypothetical protein
MSGAVTLIPMYAFTTWMGITLPLFIFLFDFLILIVLVLLVSMVLEIKECQLRVWCSTKSVQHAFFLNHNEYDLTGNII